MAEGPGAQVPRAARRLRKGNRWKARCGNSPPVDPGHASGPVSLEPIRWWEAHPARLALELDAMAAVAPEVAWTDAAGRCCGGGWEGLCPVWPFQRPQPLGLDNFLDARRFRIRVRLSPAHPLVSPIVYPLDPEPDIRVRTLQAW